MFRSWTLPRSWLVIEMTYRLMNWMSIVCRSCTREMRDGTCRNKRRDLIQVLYSWACASSLEFLFATYYLRT
jgi:hypothetical protein